MSVSVLPFGGKGFVCTGKVVIEGVFAMLALQNTYSSPLSVVEDTPPAKEELRFCPGVLIEITGPEARNQAARLLAAYPACPAAWIEQSLDPFPDEIRRIRLNWDKVLFIDGQKDSPWALSSFVRSGLFPFVVYYAPYGNERDLRRLRRLAKQTGTMILLLGEETFPAWQIYGQYKTHQGRLEFVRGRRV